MGKIIAILVIMVVINLFMLFAVKKAAARADVTIRKYFLDAVSGIDVLDELTGEEAGSAEVLPPASPDSEAAAGKGAKAVQGGAAPPSRDGFAVMRDTGSNVINYKNIDFKKEYKMVKSKMTLSKRDIIQDVINHEEAITDKNFYKIIENIRERFNFDMIYNLSTLGSEEQLIILRETLLSEEQKILESFLKEECEGEFNCIDFFNYVEQLSYIYDTHYYVMTGWETDNFESISDNIVMIYDRNICEGIKVMHQNRLHDYSI